MNHDDIINLKIIKEYLDYLKSSGQDKKIKLFVIEKLYKILFQGCTNMSKFCDRHVENFDTLTLTSKSGEEIFQLLENKQDNTTEPQLIEKAKYLVWFLLDKISKTSPNQSLNRLCGSILENFENSEIITKNNPFAHRRLQEPLIVTRV